MSELPVELVEDEHTGDRFLIYADLQGLQLDIHFRDETLWMTQDQIARLFGRDVSVISRHISNIFSDGELEAVSNLQKMQIANSDKPVSIYSLDMVISVGYRVSSAEATRFRRWATGVLVQYARKGFVVDVRRLKSGDHDRIAELREIIRDLRADEANVYRELKRICSLCRDYDPESDSARQFFQRTQAKLVYAVVNATPAEIVHSRADYLEENMGLRSWSREEIRKADIAISKNYLAEPEIKELNRLTTILLDIFEDQMDMGRIVTIGDATKLLDMQLFSLGRSLLKTGGSISAEAARLHAEKEYGEYDRMRKAVRHAQADSSIRDLAHSAKALTKASNRKLSGKE
jgi:hypothetical protein